MEGLKAAWPEALDELPTLEAMRKQWLQPQLDLQMEEIDCSLFSRHMWSHAKHLDFDHKKDLYAWCCENMEVEVVHQVPVIAAMKTAGTKNCSLCMAEHIDLFNGFKKILNPQKLTTY